MSIGKKHVIAALISGFAFALAIMSVDIYLGYRTAYEEDLASYTVRLGGLSIYHLTQHGSQYSAVSIGQHMGIICGICMVLAVLVQQALDRMKLSKERRRK